MAHTPEWAERVECSKEHAESSLKSDFKVYSAWCWGDCYGYIIKKIVVDDDGDEELVDTNESCWGFHGRDHKESGLLESAQSSIDGLIAWNEKEAIRAHEAACRDIATIG